MFPLKSEVKACSECGSTRLLSGELLAVRCNRRAHKSRVKRAETETGLISAQRSRPDMFNNKTDGPRTQKTLMHLLTQSAFQSASVH